MHHPSNSRSNRDHERLPLSREEELRQKRLKWEKEQELKKKHEDRKQKMIREYELKRARELASQKRSDRSSYSSSPSRSKSRDRSRSSKKSSSCKTSVMSEKCDPGSSNNILFKGPEGKKINVNDLKKIKIEIKGKEDSTEKTVQIEHDIKPEDVIVLRREGGFNSFEDKTRYKSSLKIFSPGR